MTESRTRLRSLLVKWHHRRRTSVQMSKDKNAVGRNYSVCTRYRLSHSPLLWRRKPFRRRSQPSNFVYMRGRDSPFRTIDKLGGTKRTKSISPTWRDLCMCASLFRNNLKSFFLHLLKCLFIHSIDYYHLLVRSCESSLPQVYYRQICKVSNNVNNDVLHWMEIRRIKWDLCERNLLREHIIKYIVRKIREFTVLLS